MKKNEKEIDPLLGDQKTPTPGVPKPEKIKPILPATPVSPSMGQIGPKPATPVDTVAQTKAILDAQDHVNFIIPMADGEKPGAYETVQINGYKLTIQKNVLVSIPISVMKLLAEKYKVAISAGADKRIDRDAKVADALS